MLSGADLPAVGLDARAYLARLLWPTTIERKRCDFPSWQRLSAVQPGSCPLITHFEILLMSSRSSCARFLKTAGLLSIVVLSRPSLVPAQKVPPGFKSELVLAAPEIEHPSVV